MPGDTTATHDFFEIKRMYLQNGETPSIVSSLPLDSHVFAVLL
jgi:hypothetical protein